MRVPGVIKLRNGEYTSLNLHIDIEQTLAMRASIIRHTAEIFDPDLFIVDKEPLGLRGEVRDTLRDAEGARHAAGARPARRDGRAAACSRPNGSARRSLPALRDLYDEIWVYGLPQICDPLEGIELPQSVRQKMVYTGYLRRDVPQRTARRTPLPEITERPYLLVTTGGGGDGEALIDWVLRAYEHDPPLPYPALLVLGPVHAVGAPGGVHGRAPRGSKRVDAITFDAQLETLMARAVGVVAMGGYNTFCEILSLRQARR